MTEQNEGFPFSLISALIHFGRTVLEFEQCYLTHTPTKIKLKKGKKELTGNASKRQPCRNLGYGKVLNNTTQPH